jgi:hypothetical protein
VSYCPVHVPCFYQIPPSKGFSWLPPARFSGSEVECGNCYDQIRVGLTEFVYSGSWLGFGDSLSPWDGCTSAVFPPLVLNTVPPRTGPAGSLSGVLQCLCMRVRQYWLREFNWWCPDLEPIQGPLWVPVIQILLCIKHIHQSQLKRSSSEGVGSGGLIMIIGTLEAFTVSAAAGVYHLVSCLVAQSCTSHKHGVSAL